MVLYVFIFLLFQGCQRDIMDLFVSEQKEITLDAYETIKKVDNILAIMLLIEWGIFDLS